MTAPAEQTTQTTHPLPQQHALLPVRLAALATGAFAGLHLFRITLSSALPMPAFVATLSFLIALGLLAFEHPLATKISPRSRRLQLAMRFGFLASIGIVGFVTTERVGMMAFVGATLAVLLSLCLREVRTIGLAQLAPPALIGVALAWAFHASLSTSLAWTAVAVVIALASFSCIAAVMRGGPGRPPARLLDVLWLFGLGGAFVLSLALISQ